jgi:hypothetical protein
MRLVYWSAVTFAGLTLVLVVANMVLLTRNQAAQAEVNQRQQFINQSLQLSRVNEALVRAVAAAAVNNSDDRLRDLLAQQGITIGAAPGPAAAPGAAPPAASPAKKGP